MGHTDLLVVLFTLHLKSKNPRHHRHRRWIRMLFGDDRYRAADQSIWKSPACPRDVRDVVGRSGARLWTWWYWVQPCITDGDCTQFVQCTDRPSITTVRGTWQPRSMKTNKQHARELHVRNYVNRTSIWNKTTEHQFNTCDVITA